MHDLRFSSSTVACIAYRRNDACPAGVNEAALISWILLKHNKAKRNCGKVPVCTGRCSTSYSTPNSARCCPCRCNMGVTCQSANKLSRQSFHRVKYGYALTKEEQSAIWHETSNKIRKMNGLLYLAATTTDSHFRYFCCD